jgi:3',5'-cyclic AMP phosphodiesterase CpdA
MGAARKDSPDHPIIAVIADAHYHDMANDYGMGMVINGETRVMRSWADTRRAARAVNESAGALTATLDRICAAGIRHVVLLGDYTDDGQAETTASLAALLHKYQQTRGLQFFAIPGNHDVYGTHGKHVAVRYASGPGETRLVTSDPKLAAEDPSAVIAPGMRCGGLPDALRPMAAFGLFRQPGYLHWETPFGLSDDVGARSFDAVSADGSVTQRLMDASYLVEPAPGLWLLMIDANVFVPRNGIMQASRKRAFHDPSDAGWNAVLQCKPFLLPWIADVCARADASGKSLLSFSHYPALDPFEDRSGAERALFGDTDFARRTPDAAVATALHAAGLRAHFSGHLHVNAATRHQTLQEWSVPSIVAYPAGYALLTPRPGKPDVTIVPVESIPPDPAIHALYAMDGKDPQQDLAYGSFLLAQYRCRIASRVIPRDWPPDILSGIEGWSVADLFGLMSGAHATAEMDLSGTPGAALVAYRLHELILDWYCLRQAQSLGQGLLDSDRLRVCAFMAQRFGTHDVVGLDRTRAFFARFLAVLGTSLRRMANKEANTASADRKRDTL